MRKPHFLQNRHFQNKSKKSSKNRSKIHPKSSQNPLKIAEKSKKSDKKSHDDVRGPKNAKKIRKNAKNDPTWPQEPSKRRGIICAAGLRDGLSADHLSWENALRASGAHGPSRWGEDPRAL